jgi:hypothetical protein
MVRTAMAADFLDRDFRGTSFFDRNDTPRGEVGACGSYEEVKGRSIRLRMIDAERW